MRTRQSGFERLVTAVALILAAVVVYFLSQKIYHSYRDQGEGSSISAGPESERHLDSGQKAGEVVTFLPPLVLKGGSGPKPAQSQSAPPPPKPRRSP